MLAILVNCGRIPHPGFTGKASDPHFIFIRLLFICRLLGFRAFNIKLNE